MFRGSWRATACTAWVWLRTVSASVGDDEILNRDRTFITDIVNLLF